MFQCETCGTAFEDNGGANRFCSPGCFADAQRATVRSVCADCGEEYDCLPTEIEEPCPACQLT
ncbi:hypothetical protein [Natrarchaeobaculum sulfurireducens]|uniref:Uncharacterized protein n=1 Tax=Natrarchaeobaculum sulfurireducens TaxID=2044521 RepID=A0A346PPR4_9EURY|nr:hypothetical protein [Natrarchaeobaculum sulfurireducens]AXR81509.1 hypothetical protein AArcMg_1496 [Natrarchaeobaculum sulfurireducens]